MSKFSLSNEEICMIKHSCAMRVRCTGFFFLAEILPNGDFFQCGEISVFFEFLSHQILKKNSKLIKISTRFYSKF
jgi:hypothetical protein